MPDDPNTVGTAFDLARAWYRSFLRAELLQKGDPDADQHLEELTRIVPSAAGKPGEGPVAVRLQVRVTDYEIRVNSETGELISWFADFLSVGGSATMPHDEALKLANAFVKLPPGAELESAEYETAGDRTFLRARWLHRHQDLVVEGDYIEVLFNADAKCPFSISRLWRTPNLTGTPVWR